MWLAIVWFVLYVVIVGGYVILDGFDLGTGILGPFVSKGERERRVLLNAIGPVWDGNEVWLVLAGGALFAAFPLVYASLFSGFYLAMMLILVVLILRAVAIEFRSKRESAVWRRGWDGVFFASSLGITLLLGIALGNVVQGVALDANGNIDESLVGLLTPYPIAVGVAAVLMLTLHGCIYLTLKTEDELLARLERLAPRLMIAFFVVMTGLIAWTLAADSTFSDNYRDRLWTLVFPVLALAAVITAWRLILVKNYLAAFFASGTMIALLMGSVAAGLYPVMIPSSIDSAFDLTVQNASAANNTLTVMLVIAVIGMPFVLLYTAGIYYFFRGRVKLDAESY